MKPAKVFLISLVTLFTALILFLFFTYSQPQKTSSVVNKNTVTNYTKDYADRVEQDKPTGNQNGDNIEQQLLSSLQNFYKLNSEQYPYSKVTSDTYISSLKTYRSVAAADVSDAGVSSSYKAIFTKNNNTWVTLYAGQQTVDCQVAINYPELVYVITECLDYSTAKYVPIESIF
jgi:hypothetical protein